MSPSLLHHGAGQVIPCSLAHLAVYCAAGIVLQLELRGQGDVRLDPGSFALTGGRVHFQFEAAGGTPTDFQILRAGTLLPAEAWVPVADATVEAITDGRYRASIDGRFITAEFFRIRRTGAPPAVPAPVLNELMSDNVSAYSIPDGRYLDWIELYNPHDEVVSLAGLALADGSAERVPWPLPALQLQPGAYLLIHASDAPEPNPNPGFLIAPFGLRSAGETLVLLDGFGRELDRVMLPPLKPDQSIGRQPDGGPGWAFFGKAQATPGTTNSMVATGPVVAPAEFSIDGGFHGGAVDLTLRTRHPGGTIRFTLDGSPPTISSPTAPDVLRIERTVVIRATVFDAEGRASDEIARTFFMGARQHAGLPVLSLAAPPGHFEFRNGYLFGMTSRVLNSRGEVLQSYPFSGSNAWLDREAEISLELYEPDGTPGLRQRAGLKVYGGWGSRGYPQKSLAILARRQYGNGSFKHDLFPGSGIEAFESFVLRNSGNDNQSTHQIPPRPPITQFGSTKSYGSYFVNGTFTLMRDGLMQRLVDGHTRLDLQAYRPAVVYINGQYWGLYNLREKLSEHYVLTHHELPEGSIDLIEGYGDVRAGDVVAYRALRDFVNTRSMAVETNFQHVVSTYLDVDNFIDYHLAVLYFQNFDIGNIKCWRPRTPRGRFHWMVYDQDYGFGLWPANVYEPAMARDYADYSDMFRFSTAGTGTSTGWPNAGGRTLLLRRLLANPGFRDRFIRRCTDLLNSAFREERVTALIDESAAVIRPEIPRHLQRWSWDELVRQGYGAPYQREYQPFVPATWETNLLVLHDFARERPSMVRAQCGEYFGLRSGTGTLRLEVHPPGAGTIRLNSLHLTNASWSGIYFTELTNDLQAVANPGFSALGWTTSEGKTLSPFLRTSTEAGVERRLIAEFKPASTGGTPLAMLWITEINYHSPDDLDADDWVELYNPGSEPVDLEGWVLRDQRDESACILPKFRLQPGASCTLARSVVKFQWAHPTLADPVAAFDFGLGNDSDTLRLFDPHGTEVQRVPYRDEAPWPMVADGKGSTLQRVPSIADPSLPQAWRASPSRGGTPGTFP